MIIYYHNIIYLKDNKIKTHNSATGVPRRSTIIQPAFSKQMTRFFNLESNNYV